MSASRPGDLVDPACPQPEPESPGRTGRPRGPSDPSASRQREPVEIAGNRNRARVTRKSLSTLQVLEHGPRSPGTFGRARRTSSMVPSLPGELVDNAFHRPERESPGSAGGHHGPSEMRASCPGELVGPASPQPEPDSPKNWSTPWALAQGRELPGRSGRTHGPSDRGPSNPGELVDPVGPRNRARVTRVSWSTPRDHGRLPESPGTACQHRRPSDLGPSSTRQVVDRAGLWTLA